MEQKSNVVLEVRNDVFYVKKEREKPLCSFAYLHLAEKADETFLAVFENTETKTPIVYWWEEDNVNAWEETRQFIIEFIGEAYLSLYNTRKLVNPVDKSLWSEAHLIESIAPLEWWDIVKDINRENYGSKQK